jgi:hypothetical protein
MDEEVEVGVDTEKVDVAVKVDEEETDDDDEDDDEEDDDEDRKGITTGAEGLIGSEGVVVFIIADEEEFDGELAEEVDGREETTEEAEDPALAVEGGGGDKGETGGSERRRGAGLRNEKVGMTSSSSDMGTEPSD